METLDDRVSSLEETVHFCIGLNPGDAKSIPKKKCYALTTYGKAESAPSPPKDEDLRSLEMARQNIMLTQRLMARITGKRLREGTIGGCSRNPSSSFDNWSTCPIIKEVLDEFSTVVKKISSHISFAEAWKMYPFFRGCFWQNKERQDEIEALYDKSRNLRPIFRTFHKFVDAGLFVALCSIYGYDFDDSLCDSGAGVSLNTATLVELMEITDMCQSKMR